MTEELHKLGDVLRSTRESRGIDLARVERDTKIRTRYLSALEHGEYRELPGAVYTKGFLRNYGQYLGLDPDYLIDLYRLETDGAVVERPMAAPPRPMKVRRARALVVTPGAIAAAILTVAVVAFVGYLVYEFVTFARTPDLRITSPAGDVANWRATEYTIVGQTAPNAQVTVDGLRENPVVTADATGAFRVAVKLVPGSNVITLVANDPVTHRDSASQTRTIEVDLGGPTPSPGTQITMIAPADGATVTGPVTVTGTATAAAVLRIEARLVSAAAPGFTVSTAAGAVVKVPTPGPGTVVAASATAGGDGAFTARLVLAAGTWQIGVIPAASASPSPGASTTTTPAASASAVASPSVSRRVTVRAAAGLSGSVAVAKGPSYLVVLQDNVPLAGVSGHTIPAGRTIAVTADQTLLLRAGNAGAVTVTINGIRLGLMGGSGQVVEWHIRAGA